jgi:hypothetical protein
MDRATRGELIERYKAGFGVVDAALARITDAELDARPDPAEWTAREVVHHLADSEMTSAIRLRRLLAEDDPTIHGYDQNVFAKDLFYSERPIGPALEAFRAARDTTSEILDRLSEEQWARQGRHTETGRYGVETWLEIYAAHAHDHAAQLERCRGVAGRVS